jgi:hypothetical protein
MTSSVRERIGWWPWPAVLDQKGRLSCTDDAHVCPWLSEALRSITARLRPQPGHAEGTAGEHDVTRGLPVMSPTRLEGEARPR